MDRGCAIFNSFRKNTEEHVYAKSGEHYIFYAEENTDNQFSIFYELAISDCVFFGYPIGSKLQVICRTDYFTDYANTSPFLYVVITNYCICNEKGEQLHNAEYSLTTDTTNRRIKYIAGMTVRYTLPALNYVSPETNMKIWLIWDRNMSLI